jgi:hypothetical protein
MLVAGKQKLCKKIIAAKRRRKRKKIIFVNFVLLCGDSFSRGSAHCARDNCGGRAV